MEKSTGERVVVLVDMDCFYVQVEQELCPEYQNKPCAVVQYKNWKGGGIIAVNYEARARGVSRMLRGDEALKLCPDIHLFRVPEVRGKADLTRYREAGAKVLNVICQFSDCVERASVDEAYLDMTSIVNQRIQTAKPVTTDQLPNTFVVGWENEDPAIRKCETEKWLQMIYEENHLYNDRLLAVAAVIVEEMRTAVYDNTGYRCSAGIAHNKMLAKLSCGIHKPNKQTVLPLASIQLLFDTIPIKKVRNLGGKLGEEVVKKLNVEKMGELFHIEKSQLVSHFGEKNGNWLYNLARGIENEPVIARHLPKSIGCGKNFPGKTSLSTKHEVNHWLKQLSLELTERLVKDQENNRRVAHLLTISVRNCESSFSMVSRSCPIHIYDADKLAHDAFLAISKLNMSTSQNLWQPTIWTLSMAASKFEDKLDSSNCNIQSYLVNKKYTEKTSELNESVSNQKPKEKSDLTNDCVMETDASVNQFTKHKRGIANFFNKKSSSDSNMEKEDRNYNLEQNSMIDNCCKAIDSFHDESTLKQETSNNQGNYKTELNLTLSENQTSLSFDTNSSDIRKNQSSPKIGFFARKLAERLKKSCPVESNLSDFLKDVEKPIIVEKGVNMEDFPISLNFDCTSSNEHQLPSTSLEHDMQHYTDVPLHSNPDLTKICDKCNKHILIWDEEEHLDYHMALDLSKEFSMKTATLQQSTKSSNEINKPKHPQKRKNAKQSSVQSKKISVQSNTLDMFFKQK